MMNLSLESNMVIQVRDVRSVGVPLQPPVSFHCLSRASEFTNRSSPLPFFLLLCMWSSVQCRNWGVFAAAEHLTREGGWWGLREIAIFMLSWDIESFVVCTGEKAYSHPGSEIHLGWLLQCRQGGFWAWRRAGTWSINTLISSGSYKQPLTNVCDSFTEPRGTKGRELGNPFSLFSLFLSVYV